MGAHFAEIDIRILKAHIYFHFKVLVCRMYFCQYLSGDTGGDISLIYFAVPMAGKRVVLSGTKPFDLMTVHRYAAVHAAVPVAVMLD